MGHPLGLTLRLATGGYLGLTPPCLLVLKIVPPLTELPIFQIALQQKDPAPLAQKMGPIGAGPTILAVLGRKISIPATHAATEKPLTRSTATWPNFHIKRERAVVQRSVGGDRAMHVSWPRLVRADLLVAPHFYRAAVTICCDTDGRASITGS